MRKIKRPQIWCGDVSMIQRERRNVPLSIKQEMWEKPNKDLKTFEFDYEDKKEIIQINVGPDGNPPNQVKEILHESIPPQVSHNYYYRFVHIYSFYPSHLRYNKKGANKYAKN